MKPLVLASASPRRKELLDQLGLKFLVVPPDVTEVWQPEEDAGQAVRRLSAEKAREVAQRWPESIILGADSVMSLDGRTVGKPVDVTEAKRWLQAMNGQRHDIITGFTLIDAETGHELTDSVTTAVYFRQLTENEIDRYVATGEPMGKAGAYAIQGRAAVFVERIEGDYSSIVGLPLAAVAVALRQFGIVAL